MRQRAGYDAVARRRAGRRRAVGALEKRAIGCQAVHRRRGDLGVAGTAHRVRRLLVGEDEQDVRSLFHAVNSLLQMSERRSSIEDTSSSRVRNSGFSAQPASHENFLGVLGPPTIKLGSRMLFDPADLEALKNAKKIVRNLEA